MAHVYEGLLDHMKDNGCRVLFERYRLPPWRKAVLAGRAWFFSHGLI
jgi:phytoene/squalene synthetase